MTTCRSRIFTLGAAVATLATVVAGGVDQLLFPLSGMGEEFRGLTALGSAVLVAGGAILLLGHDLQRAVMQNRHLQLRSTTRPAHYRPLRQPAAWVLQPLLDGYLQQVREQHAGRTEAEERVRELNVQLRIAESDREELEGILHALRDAVLVVDDFGDLAMANEAAAQIFGVTLEEVLEHRIDDVINDVALVRLVHEARESGNPTFRRLVEHRLVVNRRTEIFEVSLSSMSGGDGQVAGVIVILHNVTTEREISDMKSDFVSKASHELKTPLSGIKAYIELLIDGEAQDDASRLEFYEIIQNEADRLGRLIESMLNISRIEAGIIQVEWEDLDLCDLVDEVIGFMLPQAQSKNLTLAAKRPVQAVRAEADRNLIQQVITNLISNAIKYTPEGGRITVTSALADCDQSAMIAVSDTGLGISPDDIPRLFDKFYRIENYKRVAKGTGLGLNLVKQIVETVHGGEIGVESQLGLGSKFWFSIACRRQGRAAA